MKTSTQQLNRGFTIVELMVSLTIGLVVTWAVTSLFTATTLTFKTQDSAARSQETGRYAIAILSQHIRQAGFFELTGMESATTFATFVSQNPNLQSVPAIKGCDGTIAYSAGWACSTSTTLPDSFLVAYQVQSTAPAVTAQVNNLLPPNGNVAVGTDCLGQDPMGGSATMQGLVAINYFYVDTSANRLMCKGNGDTVARSLADGVEDMQILYGINAAPLVATSNMQYVSATSVTDWTQVQAVRLCIQVKASQVTGGGAKATGVNFAQMTGTDCRGRSWSQAGLYTDGVLRRAFWTTVSVRNQSPRVPL